MVYADPEAEKTRRTREQRARRRARSQGLVMTRSHRRDRQALDWDRYTLTAPDALPSMNYGAEYVLTLDDVEAMLDGQVPVPGVPPLEERRNRRTTA